jgi:hypothetical protein
MPEPAISAWHVTGFNDLRFIRRRPVTTGKVNEYHHVAQPQLRPRNAIFERHT